MTPKQNEPVAWKWHQAPVKTSWGDGMVVADLAIDKDHTVSIYCERHQTAKVEAIFTQPQQEEKDEPVVWNEGVPAMLPKQKEGETFIVSYEPKLEAKDEPVVNTDHVICPNCVHQFRAIPQNVQKLMLASGFEPPFTTPPQRKPLTDEELRNHYQSNEWLDGVRFAEQFHGIKGEA